MTVRLVPVSVVVDAAVAARSTRLLGAVAVVGANSAGGSGSVTVPTSWLAAHTTQGAITYPTTQNGQTGSFIWGVALRIIRADSDSSIQYAELHD